MEERKSVSGNLLSSVRVDTPFQDHPDSKEIHSEAYAKMRTALDDIANDKNRQSRGMVLVGEPGMGKTHLMMRLANFSGSTAVRNFLRDGFTIGPIKASVAHR